MTGRAVKEWIGKSPDTDAPPRVRRRVFDAWGGRCYLTGREIRPGDIWQLEHIVAIINSGENRESNLAPVLVEAHKQKTKRDLKIKSKTAKVRNKHLGIKAKQWRPLAGTKASGWRHRMDGTWERRA